MPPVSRTAVIAAVLCTIAPVGAAPSHAAPSQAQPPTASQVQMSQIQVRTQSVLGSMLGIDVNPDSRRLDYSLVIQKRTGNHWTVIRYDRTLGSLDVRTIDLPKGDYRVVVPGQNGLTGGTGDAVHLAR